VALLARELYVELAADLIEALDMAAGFFEVALEGALQLRRARRPRHFGERLDDLILGVVDVFQLVNKQLFKRVRLFCHSFPPNRVNVGKRSAILIPIFPSPAEPRGTRQNLQTPY
jgi:hypothetical protein